MTKTPQSPLDSLLLLVEQSGSQKAAAETLGVSAQYVHDLLINRRDFSAKIAALLGWERKIIYTPLDGCSVSLLPIKKDGLTNEQIEQAARPLVIVQERRP